jgi:two-component system LytT family sensor kinase
VNGRCDGCTGQVPRIPCAECVSAFVRGYSCPAAWIVPALFGTINEIAQRRLGGSGPATAADLLFAGGDWLLYAFLTPVVFAISRRWPLSRPRLAPRAALHLGVSLIFCAAWAAAGALFRALLLRFSNAQGDGLYFVSWFFITLPFGVAVYFAVVGIEHATRYFVEAREREIQIALLSEQLAGARFAALQGQLNPHFLFNTLNTIAVLVRDGERAGAAQIVEQLSDVLRRTLSRHTEHAVTLEEELDLVRQYLAIEQARFSDRLRPSMDVDESLASAAVPSFALQHLVENAIRHGIARRSDAGVLKVTVRRDGNTLQMSIADDGPGATSDAFNQKGHGLESTRERLSGLYGGRGSLAVEPRPGGGTIATLRIPYRDLRLEPSDAAR